MSSESRRPAWVREQPGRGVRVRRPAAPVVLGIALALAASTALVVGPASAPAIAQVSQLQQQLSQTAAERAAAARELRDVRTREANARERFNIAKREHDAAVSELRRIDGELERAQAELALAVERVEATRRDVEQAERDVRSAEVALDRRRAQFETRVVAAFKYGQMSLTDVFTSVRDVSDLVVTTTFVNAVVQHDRGLVEEMSLLLADLDERRADAVAMRVEAEHARDEATRIESEISRRLADQRAVTDQVNRTRTTLARSLKELQEDADALEEHLKALEAAQRLIERQLREAEERERAGRSVGDTGTGWVKPVNGWLSSPFGNRMHPIHGTVRLHAGVDLSAATGTPIVASRGGTVTFVGWMSGYGNTVIVFHGSGVATLYAHLSAFSVQEGQYIAQGGRVGSVGMTGTATGPHLHFEVRIGGVPQNPCGYIAC
jgi:murein DD-endopeptidase MepM/ murein hydrolase activator NlpD